MITREDTIAWLQAIACVFAENEQYLTELDSPIGDADHGANMTRGFQRVAQKIPSYADQPIHGILRDVGMTLITTIGGSSGPLYGTFFLDASIATHGRTALSLGLVSAMFERGLLGVARMGHASLQDKTMIDTLTPAVEALKAAAIEQGDLSAALYCAVIAAEQGMKATVPLQARKGRASYLRERSIGHQDPGATSTYLLIKVAYDTWNKHT